MLMFIFLIEPSYYSTITTKVLKALFSALMSYKANLLFPFIITKLAFMQKGAPVCYLLLS